jgi:uncharacterized protein (DUF58 family)
MLIGGCLALWAIGYQYGGFAAWFLFYCFVAILLNASMLSLSSLSGLKVERVLSHTAAIAGEDLLIAVRVTYGSLMPLPWLVVKEEWVHHGDERKINYQKLMFPWFRSSFVFRYRLMALERGIYEFAGFEASTGDLFGFAVKKRRAAARTKVVVYPRPVRLSESVKAFGVDGEKSAVNGPQWQVSPQVSSVRDYVHGDPLPRIHWKSTARHGRLMTKEPERTEQQKLMLLLDTAPAAAPAAAAGPLLEQRVALAAGCFAAAAAARQSCGFAADKRIAPQIRQDLALAYEALASVGGRPAPAFPYLVRKEAADLPPGASMLCITSTLDGFLLRAIAEARSRKRPVHVVYVHAGASLSVTDREGAAQLQALGCSFTDAPHPRSAWRPACTAAELAEPGTGTAASAVLHSMGDSIADREPFQQGGANHAKI